MSCCPPGSVPYLAASHSQAGTIETISGAEFYAVGSSSAKVGVLIAPDIFGWSSGRTRSIADHLAQTHNAYVVIPKFLSPPFEGGTDGDGLPANFDWATRMGDVRPWMQGLSWEASLRAVAMATLGHMIAAGVEKIGLLGFCWGGWVCAKLLADSDMPEQVVCAISPHPSVLRAEEQRGGDGLDLASKARRPFLLMPAGNDEGYRPGDVFFEALKTAQPGSEVADFPEMKHGWVPRGELEDPAVKRDAELAITIVSKYLALHFA